MNRRRLGLLVCAFLLLLAALAPARAHADAASERKARAHAKTGKAYFDAGDYAHASAEYQAAYDLDHKPSRLYNLAVCHERAGDRTGALAFYRQYLEADPDGEAAGLAAQSIAVIDKELAAEAEARAKEQEQERQRQAAEARAAEEAEAKKSAEEAEAKKSAEEAERARQVAPAPAPAPAPSAPAAMPPAREPAPPAKTRAPAWLWPTLAGAALLTGVILDTAPASTHNGKLDGADFAPLGCYALGVTFVAVWVF